MSATMARVPTLPEEILHNILSLCITPSRFFLPYHNNDTPDERNSQLLLVSKQWLRIGTPILYKYLRLTTQAQTRTVAKFLTENPSVGRAIRALRLEGGMGRELSKIVALAPYIDSLYITRYTLKHTDSVVGLRHALPNMNLTRLYYERAHQRRTKKILDEVDELIEDAIIECWSGLKVVGFVFDFLNPLPVEMLYGLLQLPCLEELEFCSVDLDVIIEQGKFSALCDIPTLKVVRCRGKRDEKNIRAAFTKCEVPEQLVKKVVFVRSFPDDWV